MYFKPKETAETLNRISAQMVLAAVFQAHSMPFSRLADLEKLPPQGWNLWNPHDRSKSPVAHLAALFNVLPSQVTGDPDHPAWEVRDTKGNTTAHFVIMNYGCHRLPPGWSKWELANLKGWTIAHAAMKAPQGWWKLPEAIMNNPDHPVWKLADINGYTVAHVAASRRRLPETWKDWTLADNQGWSVLHAYVATGALPKELEDPMHPYWELQNASGVSVATIAHSRGILPKEFPRMELVDLEVSAKEREFLSPSSADSYYRYQWL